MEQLKSLGLMHEAGLQAFAKRVAEKSEVYSYEQRHTIVLDETHEKLFRRNRKAWTYFQEQANWYRKAALWWIVSAKREDTRLKRLTQLIEHSEQGRTIPPLTRKPQ